MGLLRDVFALDDVSVAAFQQVLGSVRQFPSWVSLDKRIGFLIGDQLTVNYDRRLEQVDVESAQ